VRCWGHFFREVPCCSVLSRGAFRFPERLVGEVVMLPLEGDSLRILGKGSRWGHQREGGGGGGRDRSERVDIKGELCTSGGRAIRT